MERVRRNKFVIAVLVLPALVVYTFVLPYPLARTAYYSLTNYNLLSPAHYIGLSNFTTLFTADPEFTTALLNTFYLVIGCIILQVPIAFLLAFWLSTSKLRYARFFRSVYFFLVAISGVAVGGTWWMGGRKYQMRWSTGTWARSWLSTSLPPRSARSCS